MKLLVSAFDAQSGSLLGEKGDGAVRNGMWKLTRSRGGLKPVGF